MLKRTLRLAWICPRCTHRQQIRGLGALAVAPEVFSPPPPVYHRAANTKDDDQNLRNIFDSPAVWKEFSKSNGHGPDGRRAGLLQNRYLTSPEGFEEFSSQALAKCKGIVSRALAAQTIQEYSTLTRDLDRLSDQLCRVIDLVDFIRNVHPNPKIQQAASQAHMIMYEYMNVLNTTPGLEKQLSKVVTTPEVYEALSEEEKVTAQMLLKDFAQSAIGGTEADRQKFVELSNNIVQLGADFVDNMRPEKWELKFSSTKMNGMEPLAVKKITRWGVTSLPTSGPYATLALETVHDPDVRQDVYIANRTSSRNSISRLEQLVKARSELARLAGYESYAHLTLSDKMAQTPEAVNQFLEALAMKNKPLVSNDLEELLDLKKADARHGLMSADITAWDRAYYTRLLRRNTYATSKPTDSLSSYFSLGTVMQGLSRIFSRLYGIRLVPKATSPGETWNEDVRRLDVIDETEGHIAVLYCDLFQRPNKSPNPAHFTLRCSREISSAEIEETSTLLGTDLSCASISDLAEAVNDGMAVNRNPHTGELNQLPTIAFICDFPRPPLNSSQPTLLSFRELSTLFHEMGHALHSMLGRTKLQNVAGTRCATDFAELPSILMEYFAASPDVLSLYARHWETDKPLNVDLVTKELEANKRLRSSQETEAQILFSVLDQQYHSASVPGLSASAGGGVAGWDSTKAYHDVYNDARFSSVSEPAGTRWQGFFGHLFGYGAVYYSYLFDRAIAGKVWQDVFRDAPLDRERGHRYREEVLRWGGGRDGWHCVAGVLGEDKKWMRHGGERAMREVGRWGAGEAGDAGAI